MTGVAHLEDVRVPAQPFDLLAQRLHLAVRDHRVAQQVPEGTEQPACLARILGHQSRDGIERVEEEMRLEMRAEPGELRVRAKLVGLECAHTRVLRDDGEDERQRPEGVVGQPHRESDAEHVAFAKRLVVRPQRRKRDGRRPRRQ